MKRFIILCLLGMATFMQTNAGNPVAPANFSINRTVSCAWEGATFYADSDTEDGRITRIKVYNSQSNLVLDEEFNSFSVELYIGGLKPGNYTAKVYTQYSPVHTCQFTR